jgi:hypothetical protein
VNLHPYDGKDRRYHHTDRLPWKRWQGHRLIRYLLDLDERLPSSVMYDLHLYSGGCGVDDSLAITLPAREQLWSKVIAGWELLLPEELCRRVNHREAFLWLLECGWEGAGPPDAVGFVNTERAEFQPECRPGDRLLFAAGSDVNAWTAVWETEALFNYRAFRQG